MNWVLVWANCGCNRSSTSSWSEARSFFTRSFERSDVADRRPSSLSKSAGCGKRLEQLGGIVATSLLAGKCRDAERSGLRLPIGGRIWRGIKHVAEHLLGGGVSVLRVLNAQFRRHQHRQTCRLGGAAWLLIAVAGHALEELREFVG